MSITRRTKLLFSNEYLQSLLKLRDGVEILDAYMNQENNCITFILSSDEFTTVHEGNAAPNINYSEVKK